MTDSELMAAIKSKYGATIVAMCTGLTKPADPALLAGIVANESGGNAEAQRYEPAVFKRIQDVMVGRETAFRAQGIYRPLMQRDFLQFVNPVDVAPGAPVRSAAGILKMMEWLSTSFGLTQIMGWHVVEFSKTTADIVGVGPNLRFAAMLLGYFAGRYSIDATKDFAELLTCWNTGIPDGKTFDPNYVANGMARIAAWQALP
jgi:hypothetical protein